MTQDDSHKPATFRVSDGTHVWFADAMTAWVPLAYDELLNVAGTYRATITQEDLAEAVQETSGIRTGVPFTTWIAKMLEAVAIVAKAQGEPPLTALCVRPDGTVPADYKKAETTAGDSPGTDLQGYASRHRLLCYQKYAQDLPADGGTPAPTKAPRAPRATAAKEPKAPAAPRAKKVAAPKPLPVGEPVGALCPKHYTLLPVNGRCDECESY
ncbi:MAG: hypothetical protein ACT4QF_10310 [Sporichthyaceae bacterium]